MTAWLPVGWEIVRDSTGRRSDTVGTVGELVGTAGAEPTEPAEPAQGHTLLLGEAARDGGRLDPFFFSLFFCPGWCRLSRLGLHSGGALGSLFLGHGLRVGAGSAHIDLGGGGLPALARALLLLG